MAIQFLPSLEQKIITEITLAGCNYVNLFTAIYVDAYFANPVVT